MAGTTYQELLDGVASYYGSGSDQWAEIARYGVNQQTLPIIQNVPGVTVIMSNSGKYLGYDYNNPFASAVNPASVIDSNVQSGSYGAGSFNAQLPATTITNPSTGTTTMQSGAKTVSTGSIVATIADRASLAVVGVSLGTKLGKLIDSAIYSSNPDWWDEHYPSINPQTWDDIATTEGGKSFIRSIFGLENDDTTMYLDERMLAYTYMMLLANGAYNSGTDSIDYNSLDNTLRNILTPPIVYGFAKTNVVDGAFYYCAYYMSGNDMIAHGYVINDITSQGYLTSGYAKMWPVYTGRYLQSGISIDDIAHVPTIYSYGFYNLTTGARQHVSVGQAPNSFYQYSGGGIYIAQYGLPISVSDCRSVYPFDFSVNRDTGAYAAALKYGTESGGGSTLDGVTDNPNATTIINPNLITGATVDDVLNELKQNYPSLFNDAIYQDVPQEDGTTQRITYIPTPYPNTTNQNQPITDTTPGINPQTNPQINPNTRTEPLIQQLVDTLTNAPTAPDTGNGDTPPAIIPTGSANALYSIYNPTESELNSFGAWLWSSNFVDQLLKLFNDPMQAIIGLHKVFAQPVISGASTIKVGYLDSNVSSNVVGNQYTTIDCGSVDVLEYFGNVFDYDPFTQIYIYLPFVGIEKLDTGDVMRSSIGVKYHVDVLTGACLAEITVTRDGSGGILYTFAGNCAVQYPISSGSYMGIVASLASITGGIVGTIASGGALAPVAMGAVSGIMNAHTRVNHSGAFSGNAGAMGVKKPYLIITRPQTCLADNFPEFDGYPANKTTTLSECSGFVRCEACHVENIPATDAELSEIEMMLKGGVII